MSGFLVMNDHDDDLQLRDRATGDRRRLITNYLESNGIDRPVSHQR